MTHGMRHFARRVRPKQFLVLLLKSESDQSPAVFQKPRPLFVLRVQVWANQTQFSSGMLKPSKTDVFFNQ